MGADHDRFVGVRALAFEHADDVFDFDPRSLDRRHPVGLPSRKHGRLGLEILVDGRCELSERFAGGGLEDAIGGGDGQLDDGKIAVPPVASEAESHERIVALGTCGVRAHFFQPGNCPGQFPACLRVVRCSGRGLFESQGGVHDAVGRPTDPRLMLLGVFVHACRIVHDQEGTCARRGRVAQLRAEVAAQSVVATRREGPVCIVLSRAAPHDDDGLSLEIDALEVVIILRVDRITAEGQLSVDRAPAAKRAGAEIDVLLQNEALAVGPDERQGIGRAQPGGKRHGEFLKGVAVDARHVEAGGLKFLTDVLGRLVQPRRSDAAAFQLVRREILDVAQQPRFGLRAGRGRRGCDRVGRGRRGRARFSRPGHAP